MPLGYPVFGGPQVPPPPVWPNQYPQSYYQRGGGRYNPQIQGVGEISNGGDVNMGPTMGNGDRVSFD